jgi:hypothetical protein
MLRDNLYITAGMAPYKGVLRVVAATVVMVE